MTDKTDSAPSNKRINSKTSRADLVEALLAAARDPMGMGRFEASQLFTVAALRLAASPDETEAGHIA